MVTARREADAHELSQEASDDWPGRKGCCPGPWRGSWRWCGCSFRCLQLPVHLPLDAKLDRLLLLLAGALWANSLWSASEHLRPRLRLGAVHLAAVGFFLVATVGTLLNSTTLANVGELSLSMKKLGLLISFVFFFILVSSIVRPSEVTGSSC